MKLIDGPNVCDNCRELSDRTYYVKFPAVDFDQEQDFCADCRDKFVAWKNREIDISKLFDRNFKLNKGEKHE